ncbi:WD-repeat protein 10 [Aphelenchoides avenae]|nr:WD-repeat protein 10 [Aphelenchus avenae]
MSTVEVPLTSQLMQYLDSKLYTEAYELACLGVTERDWKMFGIEALEHMEFQIAKKCFNRVKDCRSLMLINEVEEMKARSRSEDFMRAYVYAYAKRFREAAQLLQEAGAEQSALEMFSDLRMFDQAQEFLSKASSETQKSLLRKKADWAHSSNDLQMAADMLMASGDYDKAIRIMIENDWLERILNAARKLDRSEANLLREIGNYLARKGEYAAAANYFHQINDTKSIVLMHVNAEHWEDAFALVARNPAFAQDVYLPYANWLAERDMFDEAQIAFAKAGHDGEAFRVLLQLTENAVNESRYMDASCYYRLLATRYLSSAAQSTHANAADVNKAKDAMEKADTYYAYEPIFRYVIEPFTNKSLDVLLQMSRFLALKSGAANISKVCVLYTLAKLSRSFGCYKTARQALEQLRTLRAPIQYQSLIDIATVEIRAKPFSDAEEFMPMCYSCGTNNPILGGHQCVHCDAEFVYSFVTFEVLPLVEFRIEDGITREEAIDLIEAEPPVDSADFTVRFAEKVDYRKTSAILTYMVQARNGVPKLTKDELLVLEKGRVLTCSYPSPLPSRYFFKIISEINIAKCDECHKFFHADDFQMAVLQTGQCPVCRMKVKQNEERLDMDEEDDSPY